MKCKISSLFIAVLFCLAALPFLLSTAALGQGCGSNPLGDTSGDTDFYVSKNQNQGASGISPSAPSAPAKAAVTLGEVAKTGQNAMIQSINPDIPGPQSPGVAVTWKVEASNPNNEKMLYNFLHKGPSTGGELRDETGWIEQSTWTWNTTEADAGENQITVRVMRAGSAAAEDSREMGYTIGAIPQKGDVDVTPAATTAEVPDTSSASSTSVLNAAYEAASGDTSFATSDAHPESRTSDPIKGKPRVAPDEMSRTATPTSGPNMQMPDPSPKAPIEAATQAVEETAEAMPAQVEPSEPEVMEVEGKWTIKLENEGATLNPLTLIQTGKSVMGMGTLNEQNTKLQVSAKGSVSGNSMSLEVNTVVSEYGNKIDKSIDLELVKVDRVISGSYEMYSGEDLIGKGNVTATRFAS
jgi:hypothetical protein